MNKIDITQMRIPSMILLYGLLNLNARAEESDQFLELSNFAKTYQEETGMQPSISILRFNSDVLGTDVFEGKEIQILASRSQRGVPQSSVVHYVVSGVGTITHPGRDATVVRLNESWTKRDRETGQFPFAPLVPKFRWRRPGEESAHILLGELSGRFWISSRIPQEDEAIAREFALEFHSVEHFDQTTNLYTTLWLASKYGFRKMPLRHVWTIKTKDSRLLENLWAFVDLHSPDLVDQFQNISRAGIIVKRAVVRALSKEIEYNGSSLRDADWRAMHTIRDVLKDLPDVAGDLKLEIAHFNALINAR